jgi:hypothetical protein
LGSGGESEISEAVIGPDVVNVIDLARRPGAVDIEPDEAVFEEDFFSKEVDIAVAVSIEVAGTFGKMWARDPSKEA